MVTLLDLTPQGVIGVAGQWLSDRYLRAMRRYRYGPGVFKLDLALDGPVPWTAAECTRAGTVHIGGTAAEIIESEDAVWRGEALVAAPCAGLANGWGATVAAGFSAAPLSH